MIQEMTGMSIKIGDVILSEGDILVNNSSGMEFVVHFGSYRDRGIDLVDEIVDDYDDIYYDEEVEDDCSYGFYVSGLFGSNLYSYGLTKSTLKYNTKKDSSENQKSVLREQEKLSIKIGDVVVSEGDTLVNKTTGRTSTVCFGEYRDFDLSLRDQKINDPDHSYCDPELLYYDSAERKDCNYGFYVVSESGCTYGLTKALIFEPDLALIKGRSEKRL